jgi:hypothetical protein
MTCHHSHHAEAAEDPPNYSHGEGQGLSADELGYWLDARIGHKDPVVREDMRIDGTARYWDALGEFYL